MFINEIMVASFGRGIFHNTSITNLGGGCMNFSSGTMKQ